MSRRPIAADSALPKFDLRIEDLRVHGTTDKNSLFSISRYELPAGIKILIHGPAGLGKSTFVHLLAGLLRPTQGRILFGAFSVSQASDSEQARFRRDNLGMIFERGNFFEHLTLLENVLLALPRFDAEEVRARNLLREYGIEHAADRKTSQLSLSEQQRACLARVVLQNPKVILADDPTVGLDDHDTAGFARALMMVGPSITVITVSQDERLKKYFQSVIAFKEIAR